MTKHGRCVCWVPLAPILLLTILGLLLSGVTLAKNLPVLIIHSYHQEYPWTKAQNNAFVAELETHLPEKNIAFSTEYLDTKRKAFTPDYQQVFAHYLKEKYSQYSPNLIYVSDDHALRFALEFTSNHFPDVPIVFSGINDLQHKHELSPKLNGIFEQPPVKLTFQLLQQLEKGIQRVLLVGDGSVTHAAMRVFIQRQAKLSYPNLKLVFKNGPLLDRTARQLEEEGSGTIVLTTIGGFRSADGQVVSIPDVITKIHESGDFRIFTLEDTYLLPGVAGGWVNSGRSQGLSAARIAKRMISQSAEFSPVADTYSAVPVFDYPTLKKHGYDLSLLPAESELKREPQTFYYRNVKLVWGTLTLVFLQTLVIGILVLNVRWRKNAELSARQSERRFRDLIEDAPDSIFLSREDGSLVMVNQFAREMLGVDQQVIMNRRVWELHVGGSQDAYKQVWDTLPRGSIQTIETEYLCKDGQKLPVDVRICWLDWEKEKLFLSFVRDISEQKLSELELRQNEERLEFLANHDPLTNLANRLLFQDRLERAILRSERTGNRIALMFLDLDRFKTINDTLGHDTGDRLLLTVSERLRKCIRQMDTVARFGGDEFVIILEQVEQPKQVARIADKILAALSEPIQDCTQELRVTTSIGISLFPDHGRSIEALLQSADVAMYKAKSQGRNTFRFYQQEMSAHANDMLSLENDLHRALEQNQLELYYQPLVNLQTGAWVGVEALIRWNHPSRGQVSPDQFIPLAEETGLIVPIGEWVLQEACRQNRKWQLEGLPAVTVAVNISPRQFRQGGFSSIVQKALRNADLETKWLELEITEGILMERTESAEEILGVLNQLGVRLIVDDFGSGYSSLAYLKRFPIHGLKIDREFIHELESDPHDAAIISTIVALADGLNLSVLAEGIEQPKQQELLLVRGCLLGQGYLFGRPQPASELSKRWLNLVTRDCS